MTQVSEILLDVPSADWEEIEVWESSRGLSDDELERPQGLSDDDWERSPGVFDDDSETWRVVSGCDWEILTDIAVSSSPGRRWRDLVCP